MTAYGRSSATSGNVKAEVEIRSVNSKFFDLRLKVPAGYRDKELAIRQILSTSILRGKVEATVTLYLGDTLKDMPVIDSVLFGRYVRELQTLSADLGIPQGDLVSQVLRIPQVIVSQEQPVSDEEWNLTVKALESALLQFNDFRTSEGSALAGDLKMRLQIISGLIEEVLPLELQRIQRMRTRIRQNLNDFLENDRVDENRFEQEMLFYLEKLDITEEKVRLAQHIQYFMEELDSAGQDKGRKLNFISQEIGREINTLGAKANDSGIQQIVVQMKNELEKIKEQLANIL